MKKKILATLCYALLLGGCTTVHQSQLSSPLSGPPIETNKLMADIEVGKKIEGEASKFCLFYFFCFSPDKYADGVAYSAGNVDHRFFFDYASDVKSAAAYDAVAKSNSDVIVAPQYIVEHNNYFIFRTINATVKGYQGTIKSIK